VSAVPMSAPPGWPVAFRGSAAIASGVVTAKALRAGRASCGSSRTPTYVVAPSRPICGCGRWPAYRYVEGRGVLSGHSAAALLGADCAPADAPAEVTVPGGGQRSHPGLRVHRGALMADAVCRCRGVGVTTPQQTAYDLGRHSDLVEAVVAIDALANAGRFDPADLLALAQRSPSPRGCRMVRRGVALATDARSRRWRLGCGCAWCSAVSPPQRCSSRCSTMSAAASSGWIWRLAYPEQRIGIEYEGADHGRPERVLRDAAATPGWSTRDGGCTDSRSTRSTANRTRSWRGSSARWTRGEPHGPWPSR